MKKTAKKNFPPPPSKEELEEKAKAEEFWSDPCWTEPLNETKTTHSHKGWDGVFGGDDSWA